MNEDPQDAEPVWSPPPPTDPSRWNQQFAPASDNVLATPTQNKTLAIVSLVSGLIGLVLFGIILGPVSIVTGALALKNIKENAAEYGGRGMAIGGLVLGIISLLLNVLILFVAFSGSRGGNFR